MTNDFSSSPLIRSGICYQAYIPMRSEPSEASEMVNQVLFGETFSVLEENQMKNFSLVQLHHDLYKGWINTRCIFNLTNEEFALLLALPTQISNTNLVLTDTKNANSRIIIGNGSIIRPNSPERIMIGTNEFSFPAIQTYDSGKTRINLVVSGMTMLSIPYLWGGRSSFGFDCSGLCQNLYRQVGIEIPRDASVQATIGNTLSFIAEANPGDLAFFDNEEGQIIHVGMILGDNKILHASGKVRIDEIDHQGIFSKEQNRYTHKLRLIKKILI